MVLENQNVTEPHVFLEIDSRFGLQHPQHRNRHGQQRRLGVLGEGKLVLRPLAHQHRKLLAQRIVDFLEHRRAS